MNINNLNAKLSLQGLSINGRRYCYQVTPQDVSDDIYWNPETEPPPLAIEDAIKNSRLALKMYVQNEEEWKLGRIGLHWIEYGKWVYVLGFNTEYQIELKQIPQIFTIVLRMDGTVIEPIPESDGTSNFYCVE